MLCASRPVGIVAVTLRFSGIPVKTFDEGLTIPGPNPYKGRQEPLSRSEWAAVRSSGQEANMIRNTIGRLLALGMLVAFAAAPAFAQSTGTLAGVVRDSTGAAVPGANVTVVNQQTGAGRTVVSGSDGSFSVPDLAPGAYTVTVQIKNNLGTCWENTFNAPTKNFNEQYRAKSSN